MIIKRKDFKCNFVQMKNKNISAISMKNKQPLSIKN